MRVAKEALINVGRLNVSGLVTDISIEYQQDALDATTFGSSAWRDFEQSGVRTGTLSMSGYYPAGNDATIKALEDELADNTLVARSNLLVYLPEPRLDVLGTAAAGSTASFDKYTSKSAGTSQLAVATMLHTTQITLGATIGAWGTWSLTANVGEISRSEYFYWKGGVLGSRSRAKGVEWNFSPLISPKTQDVLLWTGFTTDRTFTAQTALRPTVRRLEDTTVSPTDPQLDIIYPSATSPARFSRTTAVWVDTGGDSAVQFGFSSNRYIANRWELVMANTTYMDRVHSPEEAWISVFAFNNLNEER